MSEKIERCRYDNFDNANYVLRHGVLFKAFLGVAGYFFIMLAAFITWRESGGESWWFYAFAPLFLIFTLGLFLHPANRRGWPLLVADKARLFITDSTKADEFIALPWGRIERCAAGNVGPNHRGLRFTVNTAGLEEKEIAILRGAAYNETDGENIVIGISTGIHKRDEAMVELKKIYPELAV